MGRHALTPSCNASAALAVRAPQRLALAMALAVCTSLSVGCDRGSHPDRLDRPAAPFTISDDANTIDLGKLRGRIVVLNLWASWCAPCVEELPSLLDLQHQMPDLAIVGVSIDKNEAQYRRFLTEHRVTFATVRDPDARINALYGTVQIPETYIIDRNGVLRRKFISAQQWTSPEILSYLQHL